MTAAQAETASQPPESGMPAAVGNAYGFILFNALSFNIVLGAPTILFAKSLGASATLLGLITALTPLLTVFQIPAARFIPRFGYKQFMLFGWGLRSFFVFGIALLPLLTAWEPSTRLWGLVAMIFCFNLLRGISSGAWLPWITEWIPESQRARYLSTDGILLHFGGFAAVLSVGLFLGRTAAPWQFSSMFFFSGLMAVASWFCIKRIPDLPTQESIRRSGQAVPWRQIIFYPPFFRLTLLNLVFTLVAGGFGVFSVSFLKDQVGYDEGEILVLFSLGFLSAMGTYPVVRLVLDLSSSRGVMRFALCTMAVVLCGWMTTAAGYILATRSLIAVLFLAWGVAAAHFNLANAKLMMATMPEMGRTHFYAFFSVIISLGYGASPLLWGVVLDALHSVSIPLLGDGEWNRFSIYFAATALLALAAGLMGRLLIEKDRLPLDTAYQSIMITSHLRRLGRFWHR